jgi:hypothetical protein
MEASTSGSQLDLPLTGARVSHYASALRLHTIYAGLAIRRRTPSSIGGVHVDGGAEGRWDVCVADARCLG